MDFANLALRAFDPEGSDNEADPPNDVFPAQNLTVTPQVQELAFPPLAQPIKLWVDASPGCGGIAWPAGQVLSQYLVNTRSDTLCGKRILELGSGTGLVGLVAGMLGAQVTVTDQAQLLALMHKNVALNALEENVAVAELDWANPIPHAMLDPDIVLAADCVYFEPAFPLLVSTLKNLATQRTEILFCYKRRRKADKRFFALLGKEFTWTHVQDDPNKATYERDGIYLYRLTKK
ncbi:putative methyltransferase-domain-containing protein, partial [Auriculariales sp. MPI-PUGE-AT-0066]